MDTPGERKEEEKREKEESEEEGERENVVPFCPSFCFADVTDVEATSSSSSSS